MQDEEHKRDGAYDVSTWEIDQSSFKRADQPKKKFFGGLSLGGSKASPDLSPPAEALPDPRPTDLAMVEMEDGSISEEKRENISHFFGRRADSKTKPGGPGGGGAAEVKYQGGRSASGTLQHQDTEDVSTTCMGGSWLQ